MSFSVFYFHVCSQPGETSTNYSVTGVLRPGQHCGDGQQFYVAAVSDILMFMSLGLSFPHCRQKNFPNTAVLYCIPTNQQLSHRLASSCQSRISPASFQLSVTYHTGYPLAVSHVSLRLASSCQSRITPASFQLSVTYHAG